MLDMLSSDTTRDFLIEYVNEMSKFDTESYRHMKGTVLTEKVFDFPGIKDSVNCQGIIKHSLSDLTKMIETGDIMGLSAFSSLLSLIGLYAPTSDINIVGGWAILVFILITYYIIISYLNRRLLIVTRNF